MRPLPRRKAELPPRARRIPITYKHGDHVRGTTSACAENTSPLGVTGQWPWNYLRVRGEYTNLLVSTVHPLELPPRARRILFLFRGVFSVPRTTSACAENTPGLRNDSAHPWNYLRVRGEYSDDDSIMLSRPELPPRARRIRKMQQTLRHFPGTTSACAENTCGMIT